MTNETKITDALTERMIHDAWDQHGGGTAFSAFAEGMRQGWAMRGAAAPAPTTEQAGARPGIPGAFITHRTAWRRAVSIADQRELAAFDRAFDRLWVVMGAAPGGEAPAPAPTTEQAAPVAWKFNWVGSNLNPHFIKAGREADELRNGISGPYWMVTNPDPARTDWQPLYAAPGGEAPAPAAPTDKMVDAYLSEQRRVVEEADRFGRPNVGGLHTNTVREACRAGIAAAMAAQGQEGGAA